MPARSSAAAHPAARDDIYARWAFGSCVFFLITAGIYFYYNGLPPIATPWVDHTKFVVGRDFFNTWMGGRSFFDRGPAAWFDFHVYNSVVRQILGPGYWRIYWSYPPHVLLFIWPFGLLPYLPAYLLWCAIGIALYLFAASGRLPRQSLIFLAFAPAVWVCVFFGQNGFYTAALLIGGMCCRDRRPILAGVLFGLLTIKPQIGVLVPAVLLLERRWITIASAAITTAALVAATALLFGFDIWIEFVQKVVPQQSWLTEHADGPLLAMVSSVFFGMRLIGLPLHVDWPVQWLVSALTLAGLTWTYWQRRDPALSLAYLVTATFLFTPYILNYDMVVFGFVVALMLARADNTAADIWLLFAVWTLPVTMMLASIGKIPLAPIVLIAFAARLIWRLSRDEGREIPSLPGQGAAAAA